MFEVIKLFGKQFSCHLQGECVMVGRFLEALYRDGIRWRVGFDGAYWWSGRAGCYLIGDEHVLRTRGDVHIILVIELNCSGYRIQAR
jgi:hypothetical protein